jgi:hypothetical protein
MECNKARALILLFALTPATTGERIQGIDGGMSKEDVIATKARSSKSVGAKGQATEVGGLWIEF